MVAVYHICKICAIVTDSLKATYLLTYLLTFICLYARARARTQRESCSVVARNKVAFKRVMPGFHHSVAVLPLPFHRSPVVKFRCSVKIT